MLAHTSLFIFNRSQAVRLPKAVSFSGDVHEVVIIPDGLRRIIAPVEAAWDDFFDAPGIDLGERMQPMSQVREHFCCYVIVEPDAVHFSSASLPLTRPGQGIGVGFLNHALARSVNGAALSGGRALMVNAIDDEAPGFCRQGFMSSKDNPLGDIAASLKAAREG